MALLSRIAQKIFGLTGSINDFGQIGSAVAGSPTTTKDLDVIQSLSQYDVGLEAIVSDQGASVLPYFEDMNSLFFLTTSQLAYLFQSGIPEWDDETEYYQNVSLVLYNGDIWIDTFGTVGTPNLNFAPSTNLDKWRSLTTEAALSDSGSVNSYVLTSISGSVGSQYYDGMKIFFKADNSNTGASTVNANGLGIKNITEPDGTGILANRIEAGRYSLIIYNLTEDRFELVREEPASAIDLFRPEISKDGIRLINNGVDYSFDSWNGVDILTGSHGFVVPYKKTLSNVFTGFKVMGWSGDSVRKLLDIESGLHWIKNKGIVAEYLINDILRGIPYWASDTTAAQVFPATHFQAMQIDSLNKISFHNDIYNALGSFYISWNWHYPLAKAWHANGESSRKVPTPWGIVDSVESNVNSGLTGDQVIVELYNPLTGNGCLLYVGTGANRTLDISGGIAPEFMIVKDLNAVAEPVCYSSFLNGGTNPEQYFIGLSSNAAESGPSSSEWNNIAPTSLLISIGTSTAINASGNSHIIYYFSPIPGLQNFGGYAGNNAANNQATNCKDGMFFSKLRLTGIASWSVYDSIRGSNNALAWDLDAAESIISSVSFNSLSGIDINSTFSRINAAGSDYIYGHFGEQLISQGNADVYITDAIQSVGDNNTVNLNIEIKTNLTINTEFKAYASRESIPNWVEGNLSKIADLSDGYELWRAEIDVSGNAAGTSMRWRITTNEVSSPYSQFDINRIKMEWS